MLKVTVIGGGSTYTPELVSGLIDRLGSFPVSELCLMDIGLPRLEIVGGFARRMLQAKGNPFKISLTGDLQQAVAGASYVITQLRVGQMPARREDEYLGKRHGLIGQETTGIGGMAKALRTIPVILEIAAHMRAEAPQALLVNFTNPSGLVTEALQHHAPNIQSVGVCNSALTTKMAILDQLTRLTGETIAPERAVIKNLGLNHLTWYSDFLIDGHSIWDVVVKAYVDQLQQQADPEFDPDLVEQMSLIPNSYLKYFYHTDKMHKIQSAWPPSRAEVVMEIEKNLLKDYANPNLTEPTAELILRGGAYYSTVAAQLLNAHYNDLDEEHVLNTRHSGAVPGYPPDWVMELPCKVDRTGIHPIPAAPLPQACFDLLLAVKTYELLTVEAAVHGDRAAARQALLVHPLGPEEDAVDTVLEDLLQTHRAHLPQFFNN